MRAVKRLLSSAEGADVEPKHRLKLMSAIGQWPHSSYRNWSNTDAVGNRLKPISDPFGPLGNFEHTKEGERSLAFILNILNLFKKQFRWLLAQSEEFGVVLFATDDDLRRLQDVETLVADATFKVVPGRLNLHIQPADRKQFLLMQLEQYLC